MNGSRAGLSGRLLLGERLLDHPHDVGLLHDEEVLAVDTHLRAGPLPKEHAIASFQLKGDDLAALVASAGPNGDDLALLRLLLGCIGDDDAALRLLLTFDTADHDAIVQWTKFHQSLQVGWEHKGRPAPALYGV